MVKYGYIEIYRALCDNVKLKNKSVAVRVVAIYFF